VSWTVEFYENRDGSAPVEEFLAGLPLTHRAKALATVRRLEEAGPTMPFPYSSQVRGKLRELRTQHGRDKIRILYFADRRRWFILLHGLIKRTDKLSEADIATAERRMHQHDERLEGSKRP
jgi:phage-related protein